MSSRRVELIATIHCPSGLLHGQLSVFMDGEADDGASAALGRVAASTLTNLGLGCYVQDV